MRPPVRFVWLRRPGVRGLREVLGLYCAAGWREPGDGPARIGRMIEGSHCFLAARAGGRLVAMGRAISDGTNDAYIQDLFVEPGLRGRGLGAALVRRLIGRLRRDGLHWIGLVATGSTPAFYRKLGFQAMARHRPMRWGAAA